MLGLAPIRLNISYAPAQLLAACKRRRPPCSDYRVSALPFGGYVRMAGQDLSEVDSNDVAPTGAPDWSS